MTEVTLTGYRDDREAVLDIKDEAGCSYGQIVMTTYAFEIVISLYAFSVYWVIVKPHQDVSFELIFERLLNKIGCTNKELREYIQDKDLPEVKILSDDFRHLI